MRITIEVDREVDQWFQKEFSGMSRVYIFNELLRNFKETYEDKRPDFHAHIHEAASRVVNQLEEDG